MAKFALGKLVSTPGALAAFERNGESPLTYIARHSNGDWGDLDDEDKRANDAALEEGTRILSAYHLKDGTKIYIITEWDRSSTCILPPSEY